MADELKDIDVKAVTVKPKKAKTFVAKQSIKIGSNKDGSPKEVYVKGKSYKFTDPKKIERYQLLNII